MSDFEDKETEAHGGPDFGRIDSLSVLERALLVSQVKSDPCGGDTDWVPTVPSTWATD